MEDNIHDFQYVNDKLYCTTINSDFYMTTEILVTSY